MFRLPLLPTMLRAVVGSGASVARRVAGREFSGGLWSGEKRGLRRLLALPLTWPSLYLWFSLYSHVLKKCRTETNVRNKKINKIKLSS
jgi:hypothetical protein